MTPTSFNFLFLVFMGYYFLSLVLPNDVATACQPEQMKSLLELKSEFEFYTPSVGSYPKTATWIKSTDCCRDWNGVFCRSGEVTAIDVSDSSLNGRLLPNTSLHKLRFLQSLDLSLNRFVGQIPSSIGNLSLLNSLNLSQNQFRGEIPFSIGKLSKLTHLDLSGNLLLGKIPSSISKLSKLIHLDFSDNQFNGTVPGWIWEKLSHLKHLDLSANHLVGKLHSSIGKRLSELRYLDVSSNKFFGQVPLSIWKLEKLTFLHLSANQFLGHIPSSIGKLQKLISLNFASNNFSGTIPLSLLDIPSLEVLQLQNNHFNGSVEFGSSSSKLRWFDISNNDLRNIEPSSIYRLSNIELLDLSKLNVTGVVFELRDVLASSKTLYSMDLSGINVSVLATSNVADSSVSYMGLSGCGMNGQVPSWFWSLQYLQYMDLSNNSFTGFEHSEKGWIPLRHFIGSNNNFTGKIPSFLCSSLLRTLDLSNNKFSGSIPSCMGNLSGTLSVLILRQNLLGGPLPETSFERLSWFDVGHNQFVGKIPAALIRFSNLEVLNLESNRISDTFPCWLSSLEKLQVLVLRSNALYGPICQASFQTLKIIDISRNHFSGALGSNSFVNWTAMSSLGTDEDEVQSYKKHMTADHYFYYSLVLTSKGVEMDLAHTLKVYTAIDFSGNRFEGEIPETIGLLKELHVLNLSNNAFTGSIPSSMGFLEALESLDLSQNQLSGGIPQELGNLSLLAFMDFSYNHLAGLVPGGAQFQTQSCSSFEDNVELFGPTIDNICGVTHTPPSEQGQEKPEREKVLNWIIAGAMMGFVPGIILGLSIAYIFACYRTEWLMHHFGRNNVAEGY